jgi:oligopeptide/dipeptide ABC transporter ATP-binding protein
VLGKKKSERLVPITGMVPNATSDIKGCAFAARCPHVMKICQEQPPLQPAAPGHDVACWLHQPH